MPSTNNPGPLINTSEQTPAGAGMGQSQAARAGRGFERPNTRHVGEICPVTVMIMPFAVNLLLAIRFRKWLRRRVGRKAGNVIGKVAIITLGRPPLVLACVTVRLILLVLKVLNKLEQVRKTWRSQGAEKSPASRGERQSVHTRCSSISLD